MTKKALTSREVSAFFSKFLFTNGKKCCKIDASYRGRCAAVNCLRCGSETAEKQVFCEDCLADMRQYPVDAFESVHLPRRDDASVKRTVRVIAPSPEEKIASLRRRNRLLTAAAIVLFVALCLVSALFIQHALVAQNTPAPGKNYTIQPKGVTP